LSYVLAPLQAGEPALYIVLNAVPEAIEFSLPKQPGYRRWNRGLETTTSARVDEEFVSGAPLQAWPRSVLAFAGTAA
jgi:glycogen operon protein